MGVRAARKEKKRRQEAGGGLVIFMKLRVNHLDLTFKFMPCQIMGSALERSAPQSSFCVHAVR